MSKNSVSPSDQTTTKHKQRTPFHIFLKVCCVCLILIMIVPLTAFTINAFLCLSTLNDLKSPSALEGTQTDYIMVLGAGIEPDGSPSPVLQERLDTAIELYQNHNAKQIIVSGGMDEAQSEISAMFNYLIEKDIPEEDVLCDTLGVNTFASMNNLAEVYHAQSAIIVSQRFHLYRAVYIAKHFNLQVYGCPSSEEDISDRDLLYREFLARVKDFTQVTLGTLPKPITQLAEWSYLKLTPYIQQ